MNHGVGLQSVAKALWLTVQAGVASLARAASCGQMKTWHCLIWYPFQIPSGYVPSRLTPRPPSFVQCVSIGSMTLIGRGLPEVHPESHAFKGVATPADWN